jgi:shikimate dehydrogenase
MNGRFLVGLIGSGIAASRSPEMHEREGRALGLQVFYQLMDLNGIPEDLPTLLQAAQMAGFAGVNITHPSKQAVIALLDEISDEALAIGAVNTVVFSGGRRCGYNTDCYGFTQSFRRGLAGARLDSVLLMGAGGAGSAVAHAVMRLGVGQLYVYDTDYERSARLGGKVGGHAVKELTPCDGLIHATPTGMASHPGMAVPRAYLRPEMWVAELVYFPLETELLKCARESGCRTLDGGGMAVFQAARAFELFTGVQPDEERMLREFSAL